MAQTTANLVGSVLSRSNMDHNTPEAIVTHEDQETAHVMIQDSDPEANQNLGNLSSAHVASGGTLHSAGLTFYQSCSINDKWTHAVVFVGSKIDWKSKAKRIHRIVEQIEQEPLGIVVFKWCLIMIGSVMLGVVLFLTGEVIYSCFNGDECNKRQESTSTTMFFNSTANPSTASDQ